MMAICTLDLAAIEVCWEGESVPWLYVTGRIYQEIPKQVQRRSNYTWEFNSGIV